MYVDIISSMNEPNNTYLEWGSGGSTMIVSVLGKDANVHYSIEHAVPWCLEMYRRPIIIRAIHQNKLHYECTDPKQPLRDLGYPADRTDESMSEITKYYVDHIDKLNEKRFDVVLIDGRFRVACALKLIAGNYVDQQTTVCIHDYFDRKQYYKNITSSFQF